MTRPPKSDKGPVQRFCIALSPETAARLEAYCQKNERPRSFVVEKAVAAFLKKEKL